MRRGLAVLSIVGVLVACGRSKAPPSRAPAGPIVRVLVDSAGTVQLDGRPTTLAALGDTLRALQRVHGGVVYSRANPDRPPNAAQDSVIMQVLTAIVGAKLPVRLVRPESLATAGR